MPWPFGHGDPSTSTRKITETEPHGEETTKDNSNVLTLIKWVGLDPQHGPDTVLPHKSLRWSQESHHRDFMKPWQARCILKDDVQCGWSSTLK